MAESTPTTSAQDTERTPKPRPEKPDEAKYKEDLAKAENQHKIAQDKLNAIKAKLDLARPNEKDSPTAGRQQELRTELSAIRQQQSGFKSSRGSTMDKIASLDAQLKNRIAEQKAARSRVSFKSLEEIDREIQRLEKQVDTNTMKLVDEKKALAEISSLRKQKKGFAGFDESQKGIDDVKAEIAELRKTLGNPEAKALSEKYSSKAKELDGIRAEQDGAYKNLNALRDERKRLQGEQQIAYAALRKVKDDFYKAKQAWRDYDHEMYKQRQERAKAEREAYAKDKRKKAADKKLEEASEPAYLNEIIAAEGLIRYFDPSAPAESKALRGPSGFAAEAQRKVDDSPIQGTALSKKTDRDDMYFMGTGGKKGKKGRKSNNSPVLSSTPAEGKFNLSIGIIEELAKINVGAPSRQAEVPEVLEKLKAKVTQWKAEQDKKTKENIAKAQAEVDRLEAEAVEEASTQVNAGSGSTGRTHDSAKKLSQVHAGVDGETSATAELKQEQDAVADVAADMKEAKIEDAIAA